MVMLPFALFLIKTWAEMPAANALLMTWSELTGRICPACGTRALVGHGRRRRTVLVAVDRDEVGAVVWRVETIEVQRVRCKACGRTHTLLPAPLTPYQRYLSAVRASACVAREARKSWRQVLAHVKLTTLSTASVRRWVRALVQKVPQATAALAHWRAQLALGGRPGYGSVARAGSFAAFAECAAALADGVGRRDWPADEAIALANWQATVRRVPLRV